MSDEEAGEAVGARISAAEETRTASVRLANRLTLADRRWYAAYTCARHEKRVSSQLEERRVDHFLPLYRTVRRWKDRFKPLELALFPGYVFVHIDLCDRLRVLQIPSVVGFVSFGSRPAALDEADIEALRKGLANGVSLEPFPYLQTGRRVHVRSGPLAGSTGIIVQKKNKFRFVLSIDLIQRSVAVEVDSADLEWTPQTVPCGRRHPGPPGTSSLLAT